MKDKTIIYKSAYLTVASGADQTFELPVGLGAHFYLQFGNITGLTCSLTVSYDGGSQYVNVVSVTSAGTAVAAGGTITTADGLKVYFDSEGATHVKVTYVGGTDGPVRLMGTDSLNGHMAARLLQLITSGIPATTTPPAVQCYTFIPDGTDELLIDATARKLWGVDVFTIDATPVYVKLYDKATAASEADTPIHRTGVPANATSTLGAGNNKGPWPVYIALTNGLSVRAVTGIADNSDSAVTTAENYINVYWST